MGDAAVHSEPGEESGDTETADQPAKATDSTEPGDGRPIANNGWVERATIEITVVWLVGIIASSLGFLLTIVALTLPWTFVYPRPGQPVGPGAPAQPFLSRISNYEPASIVTVLLVIGFGLAVAACFGTVGPANLLLRIVTPAAGLFGAWFVAILYTVVLRTVGYGYSREIGQSMQFDRAVYKAEPSTGLSLYCLGVMMMAAGSALAIRPVSGRRRDVVAAPVPLRRVGYLYTGAALLMLVGSFSEPWLRQPADPTAVDPAWGGPPRIESWLVAFRFTTIAALILLTVLLLSKSARLRRWLVGAGLVTCAVTVAILLTGRVVAWLPEVEVEVRYTYYLAIGAAVLLAVTFLDTALGDVSGRSRTSTPARESS